MTTSKETIKQLIRDVLAEDKQPEPVVNNEPWKPKYKEFYWYITRCGGVAIQIWLNHDSDKTRLAIGNCYSRGKAEEALAHMKTHKKLQDLAFKLNDGVDLDWGGYLQDKYYFQFNCRRNKFLSLYTDNIKSSNVVYCLNKNFKDKAIEEIGEQELTDYLKWEG